MNRGSVEGDCAPAPPQLPPLLGESCRGTGTYRGAGLVLPQTRKDENGFTREEVTILPPPHSCHPRIVHS